MPHTYLRERSKRKSDLTHASHLLEGAKQPQERSPKQNPILTEEWDFSIYDEAAKLGSSRRFSKSLATIAPIVKLTIILRTAGTAASELKCSIANVADNAVLQIPV